MPHVQGLLRTRESFDSVMLSPFALPLRTALSPSLCHSERSEESAFPALRAGSAKDHDILFPGKYRDASLP